MNENQIVVCIACDASPFGIGAVLLHILEDGTEHPFVYSSYFLSPAEKKYWTEKL